VTSVDARAGIGNCARLSLGTAQFGLNYGIANISGMPSREAAGDILTAARAAGVSSLDTAVAYGTSEATLGSLGIRGWRVTTKLPPLPAGIDDVGTWLRVHLADSLARLGLARVDGLLLHRPLDLASARGPALANALCAVQEEGLAGRIGLSIYEPGELDQLAAGIPLGLVQSPFSVLDRRLETSGWLRRLVDSGVEVETRSAFLQGLLLMSPDARPAWTKRWCDVLDRYDSWVAGTGGIAARACLAFVLSKPEISRVVVGVDNILQLHELIEQANSTPATPPAGLAMDDSDLLNPSRWPKS
jgi:aryl-alcohol dehydrogenase-like predicted oxidoreductase